MNRFGLVCLTTLFLTSALVACDKDGDGDGEGSEDGFNTQGALMALADAAETHAEFNDNLFAETGVMVFCRGGSTVEGSLFTDIGFQARAGTDWVYCFNVSSDRTRVALSVRESEMASEGLCLISDYSSGSPERTEITTTDSCMP